MSRRRKALGLLAGSGVAEAELTRQLPPQRPFQFATFPVLMVLPMASKMARTRPKPLSLSLRHALLYRARQRDLVGKQSGI